MAVLASVQSGNVVIGKLELWSATSEKFRFQLKKNYAWLNFEGASVGELAYVVKLLQSRWFNCGTINREILQHTCNVARVKKHEQEVEVMQS